MEMAEAVKLIEFDNLEKDSFSAKSGDNVGFYNRGLSYKAQAALRLYALGNKVKDVALATGVGESTIHTWKNSEVGDIYLRELGQVVQTDFKNLMSKTVDVIRTGLNHSDPMINLAAAKLQLTYNAKMHIEVSTSAEDVVQQLVRESSKKEPTLAVDED